ncbi:SDR family NAD(P)-dependent oxidoreductase [Pseudomonadales bacterium]|nr:SDR family NAD(P)-dependent oxidoreductase [Pseudomonadales bacterium]
MKNLRGKVVALTGAASGIGRCLAIQLAEKGCHLALADVDQKGLEQTMTMLPGNTNKSLHIVDVANKERVYEWADEVVAEHGHVDVIINNAGVASTASIEDISYDDFNWVFDIVFYGVLYGSKAFLPYLKERPEANIVNISSVNGFFPFPNNGPYNAAKHAVKGLNQTLMQELRKTNVKITSVHPGGIKTNIVRNSRFLDEAINKERQIKDFDKIAGTSAEKAASIIIGGLEKNRKRQLVGNDAVVIDLMVRMFPQKFSDLVGIALAPKEKNIQINEVIDADIDTVFDALSDHKWFTSLFGGPCKVVKEGDKEQNGLGSVRQMGAGPLSFDETIVAFDRPKRIDYAVTRGGPIKNHLGQIVLSERNGKTHLNYNIRFEGKLPMAGEVVEKVISSAWKKNAPKKFAALKTA